MVSVMGAEECCKSETSCFKMKAKRTGGGGVCRSSLDNSHVVAQWSKLFISDCLKPLMILYNSSSAEHEERNGKAGVRRRK